MSEKQRPVFLSGSKVELVPQDKKRHLENYLLWINDQEVRTNLGPHLPQTRITEEKFFNEPPMNSVQLAIELKDGTHIGSVGLQEYNERDRSCMLGAFIGSKDQRRNGHGFEAEMLMINYAFTELNMNRVWCRVFDFNEASQRCAEKVGFKKEGVLRQDCFRAGRYVDTILYAVLAEEWNGLPGNCVTNK